MDNDAMDSNEPAASPGSKVDSLGPPIAVFRATRSKRVIVMACGIVLLGGSSWLTFAFGARGPGPWSIAFSFVILALAYALGKSSYSVCPDGIVQERFGLRRQCRWSDVSEIVDRHTRQGMVSARSCVLLGKTGPRMELHGLALDFEGLMAVVRDQAQLRGIPLREEHVKK